MGILDFFKRKKNKDSGLDLSELDNLKNDLGLEENKSTLNPNQDQDPFNQNSFSQNNQSEDTDSFGNIRPKRSQNEDNDIPKFSSRNTNTSFENQTTNNSSQNSDSLSSSKDIELILSRLDTIKAELVNIHHRLDKIENKKTRW